jgi:16S rRNA processing protein RimM
MQLEESLEPAWPSDAVEVGFILDAWGIKGGFKVKPFAADPKALFSSRRWFIKPPAQSLPARPAKAALPCVPPLLKITQAREQGEFIVAQAQEVADRTAAEALRGARVFVSRQSFPTAAPGEYYWIDLLGLSVVNRQGDSLGCVTNLIDTGPHCVLQLLAAAVPPGTDAVQAAAPPEPTERLIPFVAAYVDSVDLEARVITVDWGLDY